MLDLVGGERAKSPCSEEALLLLPELAALPVLVERLSPGARDPPYCCPPATTTTPPPT